MLRNWDGIRDALWIPSTFRRIIRGNPALQYTQVEYHNTTGIMIYVYQRLERNSMFM